MIRILRLEVLSKSVLNARRVIDLLVEHPVPITWQQMVEILDAPKPHGVKRVRQILRGLVRLGEIVANENREYLLSPAKARKRNKTPAQDADSAVSETCRKYSTRANQLRCVCANCGRIDRPGNGPWAAPIC